jgi:hypothetical protein
MNRPAKGSSNVIDLVHSDSNDDQKMPAQSQKSKSTMEDIAKTSGQQAPPQQQAAGGCNTTPVIVHSDSDDDRKIPAQSRKHTSTMEDIANTSGQQAPPQQQSPCNTTPNGQAEVQFNIGSDCNARKTRRTRRRRILKIRKKK